MPLCAPSDLPFPPTAMTTASIQVTLSDPDVIHCNGYAIFRYVLDPIDHAGINLIDPGSETSGYLPLPASAFGLEFWLLQNLSQDSVRDGEARWLIVAHTLHSALTWATCRKNHDINP